MLEACFRNYQYYHYHCQCRFACFWVFQTGGLSVSCGWSVKVVYAAATWLTSAHQHKMTTSDVLQRLHAAAALLQQAHTASRQLTPSPAAAVAIAAASTAAAATGAAAAALNEAIQVEGLILRGYGSDGGLESSEAAEAQSQSAEAHPEIVDVEPESAEAHPEVQSPSEEPGGVSPDPDVQYPLFWV